MRRICNKKNEMSRPHTESTPHIAPSEQASEQEPIIEIVESAVVRKKTIVEAKCFQCGQTSTSLTSGRCKPCGSIKTRMRRLFKKDREAETRYNSLDKERKQAFCAANHFSKSLKARIAEFSQDAEADGSGQKFMCSGIYRDEDELKEKYHNRLSQFEAIKKNAESRYCEIREVHLFKDPEYKQSEWEEEKRQFETKRWLVQALALNAEKKPNQMAKPKAKRKITQLH